MQNDKVQRSILEKRWTLNLFKFYHLKKYIGQYNGAAHRSTFAQIDNPKTDQI